MQSSWGSISAAISPDTPVRDFNSGPKSGIKQSRDVVVDVSLALILFPIRYKYKTTQQGKKEGDFNGQ